MNFEDGNVQWIDNRRTRSSLARSGEHLFLLEERGLLQIIQPNSEKLDVIAEWDLSEPDDQRPAINFPCWAAPIIDADRLILRGDQNVICLIGQPR